MGTLESFRRGDQSRALWFSTIAFIVCFAVWTIFSIIGIQIKNELGLNDTQFGLLVGTPILTGYLIRLLLGIWTDQYGGRIVYTAVMLSAALATWLLTFAYDYTTFLIAALVGKGRRQPWTAQPWQYGTRTGDLSLPIGRRSTLPGTSSKPLRLPRASHGQAS